MSRTQDNAVLSELAALKGARMVVAVESDMGRKMAEGLVKSLTGGEKITAKYLYADPFEFQPEFKTVAQLNRGQKYL